MTGDGWVHCRCGARHWGLNGAAGLLAVHDEAVFLQLRAAPSHHHGTWGTPGGARQDGETAWAAAVRETREETGLDTSGLTPLGEYVLDHTDWSYVTILARAPGRLEAGRLNWESARATWIELDRVTSLELLPSFGRAWPHLRALIGEHM